MRKRAAGRTDDEAPTVILHPTRESSGGKSGVIFSFTSTAGGPGRVRSATSSAAGGGRSAVNNVIIVWILPHSTASMRRSRLRYDTEFEEVALLGRGGFGSVVKVQNRVDGRLYAVKRISLHASAAANERVLREVKLLSRLEHPLILRYYNAFVEEGSVETAFRYTELDDDDDDDDDNATTTSQRRNYSDNSNLLHSDSIFLREPSVGVDDVSASRAGHAPSSTGSGAVFSSNEMPPPSLTCSICSQLYADWSVSFPEWLLLEGSLQALNLCVDCYLRQLSALGVTARPHITYLQRQPTFLYIQTELCVHTLKDVIADWSLLTAPAGCDASAAEAAERCRWNLLAQMSRGLAFLHAQGVAHRDMKPSNVFLSLEGAEWRVKIGDLGLAKIMDLDQPPPEDATPPSTRSRRVTDRSASVVGTALYAPPPAEDAAAAGTDAARDLFSLGVVVYEMWSAFATAHERALELRQLAAQRAPPAVFAQRHPALATLIEALLCSEPARRPAAARLLAILVGGSVEPSSKSAGSGAGFDVFHACGAHELADDVLGVEAVSAIRAAGLAHAATSVAAMPVCATCAAAAAAAAAAATSGVAAAASGSASTSASTLAGGGDVEATPLASPQPMRASSVSVSLVGGLLIDSLGGDHIIRGSSIAHGDAAAAPSPAALSAASHSASSTPPPPPLSATEWAARVAALQAELAEANAALAAQRAACRCGAAAAR